MFLEETFRVVRKGQNKQKNKAELMPSNGWNP
jgi:hypothetical protein